MSLQKHTSIKTQSERSQFRSSWPQPSKDIYENEKLHDGIYLKTLGVVAKAL